MTKHRFSGLSSLRRFLQSRHFHECSTEVTIPELYSGLYPGARKPAQGKYSSLLSSGAACPISAFQIPAQQKRVTWAGTAESVCRNSTARSSTCCQSRAHCGHRDRALRLQVTTGLPQLQVCGVKPLPLCSCWDLNSQGDTSPVCQEVREPKPPQRLPSRFGALAPTSVQ